MAWPILAAAGVAVAGAVVNGILSANSAADAAKKQEEAARSAMGIQRDVLDRQERIYEQQRQDQMPWLQAGRASLGDLVHQMSTGSFNTRFDASQLANDQGYQFRLAEGQKALERSAAARGGLNSGGFMKGLARYSQDYGANEFQNAYARTQSENMNRFNRLANVAGVGQTAAQTIGGFGAQFGANMGQYGGNMGNLYGNLSDAQAGGILGQGNALGGMAQGIGNAAAYGLGGFGGGGGALGGTGGMRIPDQGAAYRGGMVPGRSATFGLNYGGYGGAY